MPYKITFFPNGNWSGGARIPPVLREMKDLSHWIKDFLAIFKELGANYFKYFHNDGELIGQEKANLAGKLDDLLGGLFLLRQYVTPEQPREFECLNQEYKFWFQIKLDSANWNGHGKIGKIYTFKLSNFGHWYTHVIIHKIKQVFLLYSRAMADGVLSEKESQALAKFIDTVAFDFLVIERVLITTDMDR